MSLVSVALRLISKNLLTNRTWAEERVLDMPLFPLPEVIKATDGEPKPVIVVYTPSMVADPLGRDADDGSQSIKLQIYIYMSPSVTKIKKDEYEFAVDESNSANALAFASRQVMLALKTQDDVWAELWGKFAVGYEEVAADYVLYEIEGGVPIPCLAITLEVKAIPEPEFGQDLNQNWLLLDQAIRSTDVQNKDQYADMISKLIKGTDDVPNYDLFRRQHGMSKTAAIEMGINPIPDSISEDGQTAAPVNSIDIVKPDTDA